MPVSLALVGDCFCDGGATRSSKTERDYVVLREVFRGDHACYRLGRRELHRLVYLTGPNIEGALKIPGKQRTLLIWFG